MRVSIETMDVSLLRNSASPDAMDVSTEALSVSIETMMAHGVDGAINGILIDSPVLSHPLRMGGFLAPLLVLLLCEELVEEKAIFLGKLLDPIKDLVDGCAAHKSSKCKAPPPAFLLRRAPLPEYHSTRAQHQPPLFESVSFHLLQRLEVALLVAAGRPGAGHLGRRDGADLERSRRGGDDRGRIPVAAAGAGDLAVLEDGGDRPLGRSRAFVVELHEGPGLPCESVHGRRPLSARRLAGRGLRGAAEQSGQGEGR